MRMPAIFVGHGSPMNALEDNSYTREWQKIGQAYRPKAILMVSAHWFTKGTYTQDADEPQVINDMYGFPKALYNLNYQVKGSQELTDLILSSSKRDIKVNNDWGIDHGAWSVLNHMYPNRDIPVVQLSVNALADEDEHLHIGEEMRALRDKGIMIIGSGNVVHNLRMADASVAGGYDWNVEFDRFIKSQIDARNLEALVDYKSIGDIAKLAAPTTDHFDPLFYVMGASYEDDKVTVFNEDYLAGGLSMTSYLLS